MNEFSIGINPVDGGIGNARIRTKDRRITTFFHKEIGAPILRPYKTIMENANPMVKKPNLKAQTYICVDVKYVHRKKR